MSRSVFLTWLDDRLRLLEVVATLPVPEVEAPVIPCNDTTEATRQQSHNGFTLSLGDWARDTQRP